MSSMRRPVAGRACHPPNHRPCLLQAGCRPPDQGTHPAIHDRAHGRLAAAGPPPRSASAQPPRNDPPETAWIQRPTQIIEIGRGDSDRPVKGPRHGHHSSGTTSAARRSICSYSSKNGVNRIRSAPAFATACTARAQESGEPVMATGSRDLPKSP